jgi:hypothetical protein
MPDLLTLDDDGRTDHPISCHNVKQQGFTFLGHHQDREGCEKLLELYKTSVSLF